MHVTNEPGTPTASHEIVNAAGDGSLVVALQSKNPTPHSTPRNTNLQTQALEEVELSRDPAPTQPADDANSGLTNTGLAIQQEINGKTVAPKSNMESTVSTRNTQRPPKVQTHGCCTLLPRLFGNKKPTASTNDAKRAPLAPQR